MPIPPLFPGARYQQKALFLQLVVKTDQRGFFCQSELLFSPLFKFWSTHTFHQFLLDSVGGEHSGDR